MAKVLIFALILVLLVFETTRAEDKKEDNIANMFVKRCDEKLPKDKSGEYDKCDSEASDAIKGIYKNNLIAKDFIGLSFNCLQKL